MLHTVHLCVPKNPVRVLTTPGTGYTHAGRTRTKKKIFFFDQHIINAKAESSDRYTTLSQHQYLQFEHRVSSIGAKLWFLWRFFC